MYGFQPTCLCQLDNCVIINSKNYRRIEGLLEATAAASPYVTQIWTRFHNTINSTFH